MSPDSPEGGNAMYRSVLALLFASVLLLAYFYVIDPTVQNRQSNDRGSLNDPTQFEQVDET